MYKIAVENLPALFRKIAADQELYLPVKVSEQVNFKAWSEDAEVSLETLKTVKSPKDAFFPQSENLYTCKKDGKNISIEPQALKDQNFVVFGMRACDVQGVKVLDKVFLGDPVDTFYQARREHGTIVALACHEPEESCFCKVFGIDAADPEADVAAWIIEGELFWKPLTEKGNALTEAVKELLADADETKVEEEKKAIRVLSSFFHIHIFHWKDGRRKNTWTVSILLYGKNCTSLVLPAEPVPSYVRPVSAMTLRITTQGTVFTVTAAGIPACTLILP